MKFKITLPIVLAAILLVLVGIFFGILKYQMPQIEQSLEQVKSTELTDISVESIIPPSVKSTPVYESRQNEHDGIIDYVISDAANKETVIESTVAKCGQPLEVYLHDSEGERLILKTVSQGDNQRNSFYSFILESEACAQMTISQSMEGFGFLAPSADKRFIVFAVEARPRTLYLADVLRDRVTVLITVATNQTLNGGYGALSNHFEIFWLDERTVSYNVYWETNNIPEDTTVLKNLAATRSIVAR